MSKGLTTERSESGDVEQEASWPEPYQASWSRLANAAVILGMAVEIIL